MQPRHWSSPVSDVLLADGTIAVIRSLAPGDREQVLALHEGVSEDTLRLRFFSPSPAAGRAYVARLFDESNQRVGRAGSRAARPDRGAGDRRAAVEGPRGGRLPGVRRGSRPWARQPAPGAPGGTVPRARRHPVRGRGARGQLRDAGRLPGGGLRGDAPHRGQRGVGRAAHRGVSRRRRRRGPARVALRGTLAAPAAVPRERRGGRCTPHRGRPGQQRARGDPRGGLRRSAVRSAPGGRLRGRPAGPPQPGRDRGAGRPRGGRGARRSGHSVMADAAAAGVGAAIVVSSGFARPDGLGAAAERELLRTARAHSVRVVGPDSQGVLSQGAEMRLNATFARALPGPGGLAIASQSGGVGFTLLDLARDLGVGVHSFVSLGAKLDVSSNDLLAAWMDDEQVTAAALHLESFGNALKFARTARRFAERKPLLGVLGGRSTGSAIGVDALFAQAGVIPCRSATEVAETAALLLGQPLPAGYRVGVVTNAGGMGMLVADLADAEGLSVPELSGEAQAAVQRGGARRGPHPQPGRPRGRPVPLRPRGRACGPCSSVPELDAVVVVLVPTSLADPAGLFDAFVPGPGAVRTAGPACRLRRGRARSPRRRDRLPNRGGGGGGAGTHDEVRRMAAGPARGPARDARRPGRLRPRVGRPAPRRAWREGRVAAGVRRAPSCWGRTASSTVGVQAADAEGPAGPRRTIGFPVVVKVADPTIRHKTDRGLVRTGLRTPAEVTAAVDAFRAELGSDSVDVRVQPVLAGVEVACGVVRDPVFGPLVRIAAGGVATEIWKDEVYLCPRSPAPTWDGPSGGCACGRCSTATAAARRSTWRRSVGPRGRRPARGRRTPGVRPRPQPAARRPGRRALRRREGAAAALRRARRRHPSAPSVPFVVTDLRRITARACRAISHSSLVGTTRTCTRLVVGGDGAGAVGRSGVARLVDLDPEHLEPGQACRPQLGAVLADPAVKTTASTVPSTAT